MRFRRIVCVFDMFHWHLLLDNSDTIAEDHAFMYDLLLLYIVFVVIICEIFRS